MNVSGKAFDTDLLVLGSGSAGMAAAIRGAELGRRVTVVEAGTLGGTCVNTGCIPSKNLIAAAEHLHRAGTGVPGIGPCEPPGGLARGCRVQEGAGGGAPAGEVPGCP